MKSIKFLAEGVFNSFRVPFFRTYHKSFLAPPKTTIVGMLANLMARPERWYYDTLENNDIKVSVVINDIAGRAKDLWAYKTYENKSGMHGRSIIRRDRLYKASYTIYLYTGNEDLNKELFKALKCPRNIPSLGLDDEIVNICNVEQVVLYPNNTNVINSVFMDKGFKYKVKILDISKSVEMPISNVVPLEFNIEETPDRLRTNRTNKNELKQVEFINCEVEFDEIESFTDGTNRVVFY